LPCSIARTREISSTFSWTLCTLKAGSTLNTGDFFTIYDIGGFGVGVPIAGNVILPGAGWSSSIQFLGTNGFGQSPVDSGSIANLTFTYTGSAIVAAVDTTLAGAGLFGYTSSNSTSLTGAFSATSHVTTGGAAAGNTSTVTVAGAAVPTMNQIVLLALAALLVVAGVTNARRLRLS